MRCGAGVVGDGGGGGGDRGVAWLGRVSWVVVVALFLAWGRGALVGLLES